jgi:hypothetical protein
MLMGMMWLKWLDASFLQKSLGFSPWLFYVRFVLDETASVVYSSEFLATDPEARVRFPALPDFLRNSGSGTGSTQPREYN